jgi:predicted NodU family carbamoyl transferase
LGIQLELEEQATRLVKNYQGLIQEYGNNLIISGGGALNVLMNATIQRSTDYNVWVPPNADDSGLSLGFLIEYMFKNNIDIDKQDLTYSGPKIVDRDHFVYYTGKYSHKKTNLKEISDLLKEDKIIGLVQGNSEIGPRALGNRSILADPKGEDKKDKVNLVKRREKYRPFAPVCRKEDAPKYFNIRRLFNLFHMNIAVRTKKEHLDDVRAATHVDGTARLQIVTKQSNKLLYDLLTEFDGVLLNTSFNVQGKPILNSYAEAFEVLDNTLLDHVVIEHDDELYLF